MKRPNQLQIILIDAALGAAVQPPAALFAPRPVSHEALNRTFGPADGSGDWQGFNERRRAATPPAQPDDPIIHAQHTDTGATWSGPRSKLPKRYFECVPNTAMRVTPPAPDKIEQWLAAAPAEEISCKHEWGSHQLADGSATIQQCKRCGVHIVHPRGG